MENQSSQVCVIMPVYNGAKTIELAIKSLFYQTYTNWNCVIVDDGSTDETKEILQRINDNRFKIIYLPKNKGRGYARQVCLDNATGDYLTYLDADDFYHPEKIESQVSVFNSFNDIYLVSCGQGSFDNLNKLRSIRGVKFNGKFSYHLGDEVKYISVTSMVILNEAKKFKYHSGLNASEDIDFFSRYLDKKEFYIINKILYYYYEFESVSYFKTLSYNYYRLIRIAMMFKKEKSKTIILFIKTFIKSFIYLFLFPIVGKNYFIKRRGYSPSNENVIEFNKLLSQLLDS